MVETEPGFKGDTATKVRPNRPASKPARRFKSRCSSNERRLIPIDTRDRRYIGRAS